jgi:hypothetical protein
MTSADIRELEGGCNCGAVRYKVLDAFLYAANCHCSQCRAATGSAYKPFAGIERSKVTIAHGLEHLSVIGEPDTNDTRCGLCGCFLYSVVRGGDYIHVAMGSLRDDPTIRPTHHIFVGSKATWETIHDDLPQYKEHWT